MRRLISLPEVDNHLYSASCREQISGVDFYIPDDPLIFEVRIASQQLSISPIVEYRIIRYGAL